MNGLKKTLSIMLCVAMIASGSFMAFAEGESNPQNVTVVEGENGGEIKKRTKMRINSSPRRFWQQPAR